MNDLIKQALDENRMLRPEFVLERGYSSLVFPEYIDEDEFFALAKSVHHDTTGDIIIHHAEYGLTGKTLRLKDLSSAWNDIFELSHEDMIIEFQNNQLFIWLPSGEHLYVVFGKKTVIDGIGDYSSAKEVFSSYVNDSGMTEAGRNFLENAFEKYSINI